MRWFLEKKIEPDKDGNMEIEKFEELSLVYYSFTTNITVILAAVVIAVLARKKKKQQEKNNDDEKSLSNEVNNQRREDDDYSFSQFNKDEDLGGEFQLYGVSPEDLGLEDDYGLGDDIIIKLCPTYNTYPNYVKSYIKKYLHKIFYGGIFLYKFLVKLRKICYNRCK